jgi:hypothetical protein
MRLIGAPLDSRTVNELVTEREGAATKVLYQIKMAIAKMETEAVWAPAYFDPHNSSQIHCITHSPFTCYVLSPATSEHGSSDALPKKTLLSSTLSNPSKETYLKMEAQLYQQRLASTTRGRAERHAKQETSYLNKFEDEAVRHQEKNMLARREEARQLLEYESASRPVPSFASDTVLFLPAPLILLFRHVHPSRFLPLCSAPMAARAGREAPASAPGGRAADDRPAALADKRRAAAREAALRFELSVAERERNHQWEARSLNQLETDGGLQEFERNALRLGLPIPQLAKPAAAAAASSSGGDGSDDDDSSGGALALTASEKRQLEATGGMDPLQHLHFLSSKLPDTKTQTRTRTWRPSRARPRRASLRAPSASARC